jgi:hypothetical protein
MTNIRTKLNQYTINQPECHSSARCHHHVYLAAVALCTSLSVISCQFMHLSCSSALCFVFLTTLIITQQFHSLWIESYVFIDLTF